MDWEHVGRDGAGRRAAWEASPRGLHSGLARGCTTPAPHRLPRKCPLAALLPAGSARAKLRGSCSVHGNPPALGLNVRVSDIDP